LFIQIYKFDLAQKFQIFKLIRNLTYSTGVKSEAIYLLCVVENSTDKKFKFVAGAVRL
jgi:hypothetical protein